jgi:hypothetical protein
MGFNKKFFTTGGIVASSPPAAAAGLDPLQNFETVTYTGNGGTQKITGYIRKGAAFNGSSSYIEIPASATTPFDFSSEDFTISMWINPASLSSIMTLLGKYSTSSDSPATKRSIRITVSTSGTISVIENSGSAVFTQTSTNTISTNTWSFLAYTRNGTTSNIYINNNAAESTARSNTIKDGANQPITLGATRPANPDFNGKIDQVRFFNTELNSTQVGQLADEEYGDAKNSVTDFFGNGTGVALYQLDEDANDTGVAIDSGQSASFTATSSNYIQLPSGIDTILNTKTFGVSFWVKAPNAASDTVFSTETTNSTFQIHANWTHAGAYSLVNGGGSNINLGAVDDSWHHIVITSDGSSSYKGYFDKTYKGASTYRQTSNVGTFLGAHPSGGFNLLGQIDQVRIFNRQLSQSDIDDLYDETSPSTVDYFGDGNGKALYKLDNTPDDESGNYDGTWNGTAAYIDEAAAVQYNGTPTNVNFLGMAFQPDFVWIKDRFDGADQHQWFDSVREAPRRLFSSSTSSQSGTPTTLTSFDSNGFTLSSSPAVNQNGNDFVAWCWKAGGAAVSNTDGVTSGSVTAVTSQVSANVDAGFSICKFTTPSSGKPSWGHGLDSAPELIIVKKTLDTGQWLIYAPSILGQKELRFTLAEATSYTPDFISIDSSKIDLGSSSFNIGGSSEHINYNFHSVDGYQRVGSYTGDSSTNRIIYTTDDGTSTGNGGFQPRWVMIKAYESSFTGTNWRIYDIVRGDDLYLRANGADVETPQSSFEFDSSVTNGFRITDNRGDLNQSGDKFLFLAIA